jgi:hypothetical protein
MRGLSLVGGVALAVTVLPFAASAMGEFYARDVDQSSPMPCDGGSVREQYFEAGNIHGFSSSYSLACMSDRTHAKWVIRSGLSCNDPAESPKQGRNLCDNSLVNSLPKFNNSGDFWDQKSAPFVMRYRLIKYAIGISCIRIDQLVHNEPKSLFFQDGVTSSWSCERLDISDGSTASSGAEIKPFNFRTKEVVTTSSKPMAVDTDQSVMFEFVVPPNRYNCEVGYYGFMGKPTLHC